MVIEGFNILNAGIRVGLETLIRLRAQNFNTTQNQEQRTLKRFGSPGLWVGGSCIHICGSDSLAVDSGRYSACKLAW